MKIAKHISFALAAVAALAFSLCVFSACTGEPQGEETGSSTENEIKFPYEVIINRGEQFIFKAVAIEKTVSLYDALVQIQAEERVSFEGYTGEYGFTITAVNGIHNKEDWSACWMIYTDLTEYDGVVYATDEYGTFTYGTQTYASATYGASSLPVIQGYTYALHYDTF